MNDYQRFLSAANFDLALTRVLTSSNGSYKNFFRHYYASYDLARQANLKYLIAEIQSGKYQASRPRQIYHPKASGALRPITLLRIEDQIVYQALVNVVAARFSDLQSSYSFTKTFGALFQGPKSPFFYYDWHEAYAQFNFAIEASVDGGRDHFSEFDLVSFYELIDHGILRQTLSKRMKSEALLDLLFKCLCRWTPNKMGQLRHGLPQGPAPSAFLAECILFRMDSLNLKGVTYLRYIDDIRILSSSPAPIRRALIQLDLSAKELGLVPQAQKITAPRKVQNADEITKSIPSMVLDEEVHNNLSQTTVRRLLVKSMERDTSGWKIKDGTHFKYALNRLNPNKSMLARIAAVAQRHPELASSIGAYLAKFGKYPTIADLIHKLLDRDPIYDSVASSYVEAMDVCEPSKGFKKYRKVIEKVEQNSEEKTFLLPLACGTFRGKRMALAQALTLIDSQKEKIVRSLLLERLFRDAGQASFNASKSQQLLNEMCKDSDPDLSRYAASVLVTFADPSWKKPKGSSQSVERLLFGIGKISASPAMPTALDVFFKEKLKIQVKMKWKKSLGKRLDAIEQRCLRVQSLENGDQGARMLIIDTFNDALLQHFCPSHPKLKAAYALAAGGKHHPDLGAWLGQKDLKAVVPIAAKWFSVVHSARLSSDLAHASYSNGTKMGKHTKPITRAEAEKIWSGARSAWNQLLQEWAKHL